MHDAALAALTAARPDAALEIMHTAVARERRAIQAMRDLLLLIKSKMTSADMIAAPVIMYC